MKELPVILASASPRRMELLSGIVKVFKVIPSGYNESLLDRSEPVKFARQASFEKAKDVASRHFNSIVIGADTIVVLGGEIFGKPQDLIQAKKMLSRLSGRTHFVITGITLFCQGRVLTEHAVTEVTFKTLSGTDIDDYLQNNIVLDKAGSYAIQEIGDKFVKSIKGDRDNVVGLPVTLLREMLPRIR